MVASVLYQKVDYDIAIIDITLKTHPFCAEHTKLIWDTSVPALKGPVIELTAEAIRDTQAASITLEKTVSLVRSDTKWIGFMREVSNELSSFSFELSACEADQGRTSLMQVFQNSIDEVVPLSANCSCLSFTLSEEGIDLTNHIVQDWTSPESWLHVLGLPPSQLDFIIRANATPVQV